MKKLLLLLFLVAVGVAIARMIGELSHGPAEHSHPN